MRKVIALIALVATFGVVSAHGPAKPAAKPPKPVAAAPACPVCHMPLSKTKTKANPVAVRLKKGGPVMYCCAACKSKMPASMLVPTAPKPMPKHVKTTK